ncbi:MAG: hypothetical protein ACRDF0_11950 [Candidatus Limnocylindria bacterium]
MTTPDIAPGPPHSVTLPAIGAILLAELLNELDEFFRSPGHGDVAWTELRAYAAQRGRPNAGYLIDALSLFAARLHRLTAEIDKAEASCAAVADIIDEDHQC